MPDKDKKIEINLGEQPINNGRLKVELNSQDVEIKPASPSAQQITNQTGQAMAPAQTNNPGNSSNEDRGDGIKQETADEEPDEESPENEGTEENLRADSGEAADDKNRPDTDTPESGDKNDDNQQNDQSDESSDKDESADSQDEKKEGEDQSPDGTNSGVDHENNKNSGEAEKDGEKKKDGENENKEKDGDDKNQEERDKPGLKDKLNRGLSKARQAKDIIDDPAEAAKNAAKRAAEKKIKQAVAKGAAQLAARSGITGFLAANWPIVLIVLAVIFLIIFIFAMVTMFSFSGSNKDDSTNAANISYIESAVSSGKMSFSTQGDLEKIKNGEISAPSLQAMSFLAEKHENIKINYSLDETTASTLSINGPFSFDIAALDKIKCIDSSGQKIEFDINLAANFDWNKYLEDRQNNQDFTCAVDYYPGESVVSESSAVSKYGPGVFSLSDITSAGAKAAQAKIFQAAKELILNKSNFRIDSTDSETQVPAIISVNINKNTTAYQELSDEMTSANKNSDAKFYLKSSNELGYGLHIEFFNELQSNENS